MKLLRDLERRLESLFDGLAGRVFGGPLHPSELATRIVRRLDLEIDDRLAAPNVIEVDLARGDVRFDDTVDVEEVITRFCEETAAERGWRLEGPARVTLRLADDLEPGTIAISTHTEAGARPPWASLTGDEKFLLERNRSIVGRSDAADVRLSDDRISRRHAMVWSEAGRTYVVDLNSANGTTLDGSPVRTQPIAVPEGAVLGFGPLSLRYHTAGVHA